MHCDQIAAGTDFFECTQCGQCCQGYGGTYVSEADIAAIASFLGLPTANVRARFCVLSGGKPLLAQRPDGYCIFFERNCTIHPVKPRMCRQWPFIPGVLADVGNWRAMADSCPGIRPEVDERALCRYIQHVLDLENR
jgi:Fe-S-cluster containining protein